MLTRMTTTSYTVRFVTPAFLGNAEQSGQWRTPPFKALLRQWWRVAYAAERGFQVDVAAMRREEGLLFGHAWLEDDRGVTGQKVKARRSRVRIRLAVPAGDPCQAWSLGTQRGVSPLATGLKTSYAWFGLVKRGEGLPDRTAIQPSGAGAGSQEGRRVLRLAVPDDARTRMEEVIRLIATFGLLGSRSRGGWGALHVEGVAPLDARSMGRYARPIEQCLQQDWAMSLASDEKGVCVWESKATWPAWHEALRVVAQERKEVRSALRRVGDRDLRAALGFASPGGRMPSPLRWKIVEREERRLAIRVIAMPHDLPKESGKSMVVGDLTKAWRVVGQKLDASARLQRAEHRAC